MGFVELLERAKCKEQEAIMELDTMFRPLMVKYSYIRGEFDYELFCLQQERLLVCINIFKT